MRTLVVGGIVFVAIALGAIATSSSTLAVLAVGVALGFVETVAILRRAGSFTATLFPMLAVNVVLLLGMVLWPVVASRAIVSVGLVVSAADLRGAAIVGIAFALAYTIGVLIVGPPGLGHSMRERLTSIRLPVWPLVLVGFGILGITFLAYGSALLRGDYLSATGPAWAATASVTLTPVAVVALCVAAFRKSRLRVIAVLGVVLWIAVLFGRSSRYLAAIPAFLLLGAYMAGRAKIRPWVWVVVVISTLVLLQLPLALRVHADGVGFLTLSEALIQDPGGIFASIDPAAILGNILFSSPLTAVVSARSIPADAFWASITPAFGDFADWDTYRAELRIDQTTPYNALGELASQGLIAVVAMGLIVGVIIALAERIAQRLPGTTGSIAVLAVMAVTALYSVTILQYNLRTSTRLLWYLIAAIAVLWLISLFFRRADHQALSGGAPARPGEAVALRRYGMLDRT
jgi:hypothetical protein